MGAAWLFGDMRVPTKKMERFTMHDLDSFATHVKHMLFDGKGHVYGYSSQAVALEDLLKNEPSFLKEQLVDHGWTGDDGETVRIVAHAARGVRRMPINKDFQTYTGGLLQVRGPVLLTTVPVD